MEGTTRRCVQEVASDSKFEYPSRRRMLVPFLNSQLNSRGQIQKSPNAKRERQQHPKNHVEARNLKVPKEYLIMFSKFCAISSSPDSHIKTFFFLKTVKYVNNLYIKK